MTRREQQALRFIERYSAESDGVPPTLEEISADLGMASKSGAARVVDSLIAQGRLTRRHKKARSIEIVGLPAALITTSDEALLAECVRRGLLRDAA